jgi:hypothetical protein
VSAFCAWARGVGQAERYKVPAAWRPTALCKTSKGRETERRPGKEEEEVTADEFIVGIDDYPPPAAFRCVRPIGRNSAWLHSWVE